MNCAPDSGEAVLSYPRSVSEFGSANISLLRQIDKTIDWLSSICKQCEGAAEFGQKLLECLQDKQMRKLIDAEGNVAAAFTGAESVTRELFVLLKAKRTAAERAIELNGEHKAAITSEYDSAIHSVASLHDVLTDLRWTILEHDANLENPVGEPFSSAEDMIRSLKA